MNPSRHVSVLKPAGQFRVMTRGSQVIVPGNRPVTVVEPT